MGILYALATLTRLPGVLLLAPLLVLQWQTFGRPRLSMAWLALGPLALLGFAAYQGAVLGDPLGFIHAQTAWDLAPPMPGSATLSTAANGFNPLPYLLVATLFFYAFLFVYMRADRIRLPYVIYAIVVVATVIAGGRLLSVGRYLAVIFPFSWVLANRRAAWFRSAWPIISDRAFRGPRAAAFHRPGPMKVGVPPPTHPIR